VCGTVLETETMLVCGTYRIQRKGAKEGKAAKVILKFFAVLADLCAFALKREDSCAAGAEAL